ncbi:MAG TPA: S16 family serine protease [Gaiellaceae bacterium]|nr:S16 family serine protease [Gaiellaceae bacterium]
MRSLSPARLAAAGLFLLGVAVLVLWLTPADGYNIRLVDPAHRVAPLVHLAGEKPARGGGAIYFVDLRERRARLLERILPWARADGSSLVREPPISSALEQSIGRQDMTDSQKIAAVVALRHLGYKVRTRVGGVAVLLVQRSAPAARVLQPGDVIVAAAGRKTSTVTQLRHVLAHRRPGDTVTIRFRRARRLKTATLRTVADPMDPNRTIIGVSAEDELQAKLPIRVRIDLPGVLGPSAGLAFALDILQELGRDVAHGQKVAATGELELDGSVEPIGGVKQKTLGARRAGVDVFLVPAGENAREARRYADGLRVLAVKNFPQALRELATIRPES